MVSVYRVWWCTALLMGAIGCSEQQAPSTEAPPVDVGAMTVQAQPVTLTTTLAGRTKASLEAEVRPQISGIVLEQDFEEGALVEKGQQLYLIDPAPYEAQLQQANAELSQSRANLKAAKARAERYQVLVDSRAVSKQDYDDAQAQYQQALASVETAKASVDTAKINLGYTRVYAPIAGLAGRSSVTPGALVSASQSQALVTVQQFDPMYVDVSESSRELNALRRAWASGDVIRQEGEAAQVHLSFDDGSAYEHLGEFKFADINVDVSTGTFTIRTTFPNPDSILLPGMFVRATLVQGVLPNGVLIPARGVSRNAKGEATVVIVSAENTAESRAVVAEQMIGQAWLVTDGLANGDRVVLEGLQYLRPGVAIGTVNELAPE
ncbi:efflux RND transporter periplasmic adaptor subunit [Ferrimonas pelagia]|uniref:Efflux RND transporter periplasmic adaptor subunit n=1 Tax=Ferrimonas pelagia TaxID=1177826 RepID=A0ABP9FJ63_9GAMM